MASWIAGIPEVDPSTATAATAAIRVRIGVRVLWECPFHQFHPGTPLLALGTAISIDQFLELLDLFLRQVKLLDHLLLEESRWPLELKLDLLGPVVRGGPDNLDQSRFRGPLELLLCLDQLRTELHFFGGQLPTIAATATVLAAATVLPTAATVLAAEPAAATVLATATVLAAATTALCIIRVAVPATATLAPLAILTTLSALSITALPLSTRTLARSTRIHLARIAR